MLDKHFVKKLREHSWEEIENQDSNKYQTWTRKKSQARIALRDLILLAKKLPKEKKREIFNKETMSRFFRYVVSNKFTESSYDMELISDLTFLCLQVMKNKYVEINKHSPHLTNHTVEQIQRTQDICSDIAKMAISMDLKNEAMVNKQVYLFRSRGKSIIDKEDFTEFIITNLSKMENGSLIDTDLDFLKYYGPGSSHLNIQVLIIDPDPTVQTPREQAIGSVNLSMDPIHSKAYLTIEVKGEKKTRPLIMEYSTRRKLYTFYLKTR